MYHKQLVTHITNKTTEGIPKEIVEQELITDGWSKNDIAEAFYYSAYPEKIKPFFSQEDFSLGNTSHFNNCNTYNYCTYHWWSNLRINRKDVELYD